MQSKPLIRKGFILLTALLTLAWATACSDPVGHDDDDPSNNGLFNNSTNNGFTNNGNNGNNTNNTNNGNNGNNDAGDDSSSDDVSPDVFDASDAFDADDAFDTDDAFDADDARPDLPDAEEDIVDTSDDVWDTSDDVIDTGDDVDPDVPPSNCAALQSTLASELYRQIGACTVAVRLDYESYDVLGYQVFCGRYAATDEATARTSAQRDAGFGDNAQSLHRTAEETMYVFYQAPGDFGGAAAVSAKTGLTVFGGGIVWDGQGELTWPASWRLASELGQGCGDGSSAPYTVGYDLINGTREDTLSPDADMALATATDTVLPAAFTQGGYLFEAVVIAWPRTVGAFNPGTAEWVVLLNGGWLE